MFESGYRVLRRVLDAGIVSKMLRMERRIKKHDWKTVFSHGEVQDEYRLQYYIPPCAELAAVEEGVMDVIGAINPRWRPRGGSWVFLKSLTGGERQQIHRDYLHEEIIGVSEDSLPCGLLVCLQPGTKLATYGWNRLSAEQHEEKIVELEPGDVLVFRGDLIHCGMEYAEDNVRLHCYLDVDGEEYIKNETQLMYFTSYTCPKCFEIFGDKIERNEHRRNCKKFVCRACDLSFSNENTLRSHRRNRHKYLRV